MLYVFDFDGTIVDVWKRYHEVFQAAAGCSVDLLEYKDKKIAFESDVEVLGSFGISAPADYFQKKRKLLESDDYLKQDVLLTSKERLLSWFSRHDSIILTKRRDAAAFFRQIDRLGLAELATCSHVLNPDGGMSKLQWVLACGEREKEERLVIGDSSEDMSLGMLPNTTACFVETGLKSYKSVSRERRVDSVFPNIDAVLDYLDERG